MSTRESKNPESLDAMLSRLNQRSESDHVQADEIPDAQGRAMPPAKPDMRNADE